jgi:hypothetical protein
MLGVYLGLASFPNTPFSCVSYMLGILINNNTIDIIKNQDIFPSYFLIIPTRFLLSIGTIFFILHLENPLQPNDSSAAESPIPFFLRPLLIFSVSIDH